jgi:hypothetical protein
MIFTEAVAEILLEQIVNRRKPVSAPRTRTFTLQIRALPSPRRHNVHELAAVLLASDLMHELAAPLG